VVDSARGGRWRISAAGQPRVKLIASDLLLTESVPVFLLFNFNDLFNLLSL
jgi:hypothetical protein